MLESSLYEIAVRMEIYNFHSMHNIRFKHGAPGLQLIPGVKLIFAISPSLVFPRTNVNFMVKCCLSNFFFGFPHF